MRQKSNASQASNNLRTYPEKEIVYPTELNEQKCSSAVSEKVV